jgi:hypothetical protein
MQEMDTGLRQYDKNIMKKVGHCLGLFYLLIWPDEKHMLHYDFANPHRLCQHHG